MQIHPKPRLDPAALLPLLQDRWPQPITSLAPPFRRQHPIWRFIADFYCASARLIIEIDGDTHAEPGQLEYDAARTNWLETRGYRVIRFTNAQVLNELGAVLIVIATARKAPSPGGRGLG